MNKTPDRQGPAPRPTDRQHGGLRRWSDNVEEQLNEARERGDFDQLEGAGKPLRLDSNVHAGDKALAYSLLKKNHLLPPELDRAKEVDVEVERAEGLLTSLRRRRDALRAKHGGAFASERQAYNVVREKTRSRYEAALRATNSKILSLNIIAPVAMHRRMLDVERRLEAFDTEFPLLAE